MVTGKSHLYARARLHKLPPRDAGWAVHFPAVAGGWMRIALRCDQAGITIPVKLRTGEDYDGNSTNSRRFTGPIPRSLLATSTRGHGSFDVDPGGYRSRGDRRDGRLPDPRHRDDERAGPRGERQRRQ